jgi:hypothetical protein
MDWVGMPEGEDVWAAFPLPQPFQPKLDKLLAGARGLLRLLNLLTLAL